LSGWAALSEQLAMLEPDDVNAFATLVCTGGHRKSLAMLEAGTIDAASIDSNTLLDIGPLPPGLRVLETWGPLPVQPVVARATLPAETRDAITTALTNMHHDLLSARRLGKFNVRRFALVSDDDYR
jgi:ABC-type phosphate/phosphonate transport system substrate-binding protein